MADGAKASTPDLSVERSTGGPEGPERVYFEVKRPNGDRLSYGLRTRSTNVLFTTTGPVVVPVKSRVGSPPEKRGKGSSPSRLVAQAARKLRKARPGDKGR